MSDLVQQVFDTLEAVQAEWKDDMAEASWQAAVELSREVAAAAVRDTGSMADSVYAFDASGRSSYGDAVGAATGDNPKVVILDEVEPMQSTDVHEAGVAVAAKHGFMVENGFGPEGHRTPQPFFEPTVEALAEDIFTEHFIDVSRKPFSQSES